MHKLLHAHAAQTVLKTEQNAEAMSAMTSAMCRVLLDLARHASELISSVPTGQPARSATLRVSPGA